MEIEPLLNNGQALRNITDGNLLHQNDNKLCHQIIILVKVVSDCCVFRPAFWVRAAPESWSKYTTNDATPLS